MVQDFSGFRKGQCDRVPHQPSQPISDKPSTASNTRHPSSPKHIPSPATASATASAFFQLWLAQPSWSPIILSDNGWKTAISSSGKKVPLTLGSILSNYHRERIVGKRFSKLTNYILIDIDISSPHHPKQQGLAKLLAVMEKLGLCRYLIVQSSYSGGLHIYFPLPCALNSWALAATVHQALTSAGVAVASGQCELFPNKKALGAEHNGHRLPLQSGSFLLDDDFRCIGNDKGQFVQQWAHCVRGQDEDRLLQALDERVTLRSKQRSLQKGALPPIAWTKKGQSNDIMCMLANYGHEVMGLCTIQELGDWMMQTAPLLPGFDAYASMETKHDIRRKGWCYRWAKSHFKHAWHKAAVASRDYNGTKAEQAKYRVVTALKQLRGVSKLGIKKLWDALSEKTNELFGKTVGWTTFQKYRELILVSAKGSEEVGLSSELVEGKDLYSKKDMQPEPPGGFQKSKKAITQLSTATSVTVSDSKELGASQTCFEAVEAAATERSTGDVVADVVRATAQQLRQVLGQACPFVGPGLWTVRREELSAQSWQQLMAFTSEG